MVKLPRGVSMVSGVVSFDDCSRNGTTSLTFSIERISSVTVSFMKVCSLANPGPPCMPPEGKPPPPVKLPCPYELVEHSISVDVLLISSCIFMSVVLKSAVRFCVAAWLATMPAGMEIMIAMEKPKAMITRIVLIFLLEMFLTALVKAPKRLHLHVHFDFDT